MTLYEHSLLRGAKKIGRKMPDCVQFWLKCLYYPWWIRRFAENAWPPWPGVRKLLSEQAVVIDVGANIGYVAYLLASQVGARGRVFAIEPVQSIYRILRNNMKRLHMPHVETFNCAASAVDGNGRMAVPEYKEGGKNYYEAHLVAGEVLDGSVIPDVRLNRLDSLFRDIGHRVDMIKIDAEGHELEVVTGGMDMIRRDHPVLVIESAGAPDDPQSPCGRLYALLKTCDYSPYIFGKEGFQPAGQGRRSVDYFFLPAEYKTRLALETVT